MAAEMEDVPDSSLRSILEKTTLKWIFVGGKGGVGKTTTSCSLAVQLSKVREKVLVVSTDPAHNLSDAFGQKFSYEPTAVEGYSNLFCMEVEPKLQQDEQILEALGLGTGTDAKNMLTDIISCLPGVDEAMSFAELLKQVQVMNYDCIVFDTAPTGHTLRLLGLPKVMEKLFGRLNGLRSQFSGIISSLSSMMGGSLPEGDLLDRLDQIKMAIEQVNNLFKDHERTTFVCVCIAEFLSLYETERLVQELTKYEINCENIVVNQVLYPEAGATSKKFEARQRMQQKYLDQIYELYESFHIVETPLLDEEVRGTEALENFSQYLIDPYVPDEEIKEDD